MIRHVFEIKQYWEVIVYYDINYNLFHYIIKDLHNLNTSTQVIHRLYYNMYKHNAKAVTISNIKKHVSVVLFNKHRKYYDYINSIVHESEHIKQAMLKAYHVKDIGEPPAYTIGYVATKMLKMLNNL